VRPYEGDLEDYRRMILAPAAALTEGSAAAPNQRREARRIAAERRRELEPLRRLLKDAERVVSELSAKKAALDARVADPATYAANANVANLLREQAALAAELGDAEARWLDAAQALEDADTEP